MVASLVYLLFSCIVALANGSVINGERKSRLLGGTEAILGEFPWIVSLQKSCRNGTFKHFCGSGTILDERRVVTAAHCVWNKRPEMLQILAGIVNLADGKSDQQRASIEEIIVHPKYSTGYQAGSYDLAILKLRSPLVWTKNIQPIQIIPAKNNWNIDNCTTVGWGNQFPISRIFYMGSVTLHRVKAKIVPTLLCELAYPFNQEALNTALCTTSGFLRGTCQGDSGGALVCENGDGIPHLLGIVSWGWFVCGDGVHPDIYTDLRLFKDFLSSTGGITGSR